MKELKKTVGILGGMGPEATVEFMRRLIAAVPATDDADHLHMLVDNNPKVPSRIKALIEKSGDDPAPVLARMARGLQSAGADFLAMPCNTAHAYLPQIRAAVSVPVLDMIALSVASLAAMLPKPKVVGLLASPAVRRLELFAAPLSHAGIDLLYASEQEEAALLETIRSVKAGRTGAETRSAYHGVAQALAERGADTFLVACTEFSLLPQPQIDGRAVLDTLVVLVQETLRRAAV